MVASQDSGTLFRDRHFGIRTPPVALAARTLGHWRWGRSTERGPAAIEFRCHKLGPRAAPTGENYPITILLIRFKTPNIQIPTIARAKRAPPPRRAIPANM